LLTILAAACSSPDTQNNLPTIEVAAFRGMLTESQQPTVVNVWASWCLPCREEAPILSAAFSEFGDRVAFVGVAYNDNQPGARDFLAEFQLPFTHYFDEEGAILAEFGGIGVPRTYFFAAGGELVVTHNGVLDAETLELQINELLSR
jgi:cytochrome c biogenesis protein CcmG/thiol:disulfide interchange protein DsbE